MSSTSSRRCDARRRALLAAGALALSACSLAPRAPPEDPRRELVAVPFFPQTIHHCGPAALATVLAWSGAAATPQSLAPQVYLPGRKGSLQVELGAAARRAGRVPYLLAPEEAALRAEIGAGAPVLVLQDFGAAGLRRWHYAVVVGFDDARDLVILRSGTERRRAERRASFLRSWDRADRWALVVLAPGRLPASVPPEGVVRAVESAAPFLPPGASGEVYAAALARWPADPAVLFAAANALAGTRPAQAEALYLRLLAVAPRHAAGRNNYASLLLDRGCAAAAAAEATRALADLDADPAAPAAFRAAIRETRTRAEARTGQPEPAGCHQGPRPRG